MGVESGSSRALGLRLQARLCVRCALVSGPPASSTRAGSLGGVQLTGVFDLASVVHAGE